MKGLSETELLAVWMAWKFMPLPSEPEPILDTCLELAEWTLKTNSGKQTDLYEEIQPPANYRIALACMKYAKSTSLYRKRGLAGFVRESIRRRKCEPYLTIMLERKSSCASQKTT